MPRNFMAISDPFDDEKYSYIDPNTIVYVGGNLSREYATYTTIVTENGHVYLTGDTRGVVMDGLKTWTDCEVDEVIGVSDEEEKESE